VIDDQQRSADDRRTAMMLRVDAAPSASAGADGIAVTRPFRPRRSKQVCASYSCAKFTSNEPSYHAHITTKKKPLKERFLFYACGSGPEKHAVEIP